MTPHRIQRRRIKGWRMPQNTVYVGRPTMWGNPFEADEFGVETHSQAVEHYRAYIMPSVTRYPSLLDALRGKNLACWCHLCGAHAGGRALGVTCIDCEPCHADVLLELANRDLS